MRRRAWWATLAIGATLTVVAVASGIIAADRVKPSGYAVVFSESGGPCTSWGIYLSVSSGSPLDCSGEPAASDDATPTFTEQERQRVYAVAGSLGRDGDGLSDRDQRQITDYAATIAAAGGHPYQPPAESDPGPLRIVLILGVAMFLTGAAALVYGPKPR